MTVPPRPAISVDGVTTSGPAGIGGDGVRMRARCRHLATVLTISGDVDALTGDRVQAFATRFVRVGDALILDLRGVEFFSARGISLLIAVDAACRSAEMPLALVPSPIVRRVLRLTDVDTVMPMASSVPAALRQLADRTQARRQLARAMTTVRRHAG